MQEYAESGGRYAGKMVIYAAFKAMLIRLRSNLISYVIMLFCAVCSFDMDA